MVIGSSTKGMPRDWGGLVYSFFKGEDGILNAEVVRPVDDRLESVSIPSSVWFEGMKARAQVVSIGNRAFRGCANLKSVRIPRTIESIGSEAFSRCVSLERAALPSSITSIGDRAFLGCASLKRIAIPPSVSSVADYMFCDCISLKDV